MATRKHFATRGRMDRRRLLKWSGLGTSLLVVWFGLASCSSKPVKREDPGTVFLDACQRNDGNAFNLDDL